MPKPALHLIPAAWLLLLAVSGCTSGGGQEGLPVSRREYEYVPPVRVTPTPTPAPAPEAEDGEEPGDSDRKGRGFFRGLFSRGEKAESGEVMRVGDLESAGDLAGEEGLDPGPVTPSEHVYKLKTGDTVYITLTGSGGLNEQIETRIDDEGAVKLRFIGAVQAAGRSTTELEREIEAEYTVRQKIYKDITVRAMVPNTFYFIGGEVRQPGRFPLTGRVTLSQAVVAAGNFTEWANPRKVILVRNNERVEIDFRDIQDNPNRDFELLAGDVIRVSRSTF